MNDIERTIKEVKHEDCGDSECLLWEVGMEDNPDAYGCHELCKKCKYGIILQALQEKANQENSQPLTLEQLKECIGKPAYIINGFYTGICLISSVGKWNELLHYVTITWVDKNGRTHSRYDARYELSKFYNHEPKEVD